jgi:hypothetical protein
MPSYDLSRLDIHSHPNVVGKNPSHTWHSVGAWIACILGTLVLLNWLIGLFDLPDYGSWTGIRPLEAKLESLASFVRDGDRLDAVILGSSIADYGFSAEAFSERMSHLTKRPYRAFNFSTGAAEWSTFAKLYRFVRLVAKPKHIFVFQPLTLGVSAAGRPGSVEDFLGKAPVGMALKDQRTLRLSYCIWSAPLIVNSASLRDLLVYGRFKNLVPGHSDVYHVSANGDMLAYNLPPSEGATTRAYQTIVNDFYEKLRNVPVAKQAEHVIGLFDPAELDAARELVRMAAKDGALVSFVLSAQANVLIEGDDRFRDLYGRLASGLSQALGMSFVNLTEVFCARPYEIMDEVHLNIHGARRVGQIAAHLVCGQPLPKDTPFSYPMSMGSLKGEDGFNNWSAVIEGAPSSTMEVLEAQFVQSWQVPKFPESDLFFVLRLPDGLDVSRPAQKIENGLYRAQFGKAPIYGDQILVLRFSQQRDGAFSPLNAPLAGYRWLPR